MVTDLLEGFSLGNPGLVTFDHKDSEKKRGFLVHLATTYDWMKPFFKGIHLTLETWRGNRRSDGWKYSDSEWSRLLDHLCHGRKKINR